MTIQSEMVRLSETGSSKTAVFIFGGHGLAVGGVPPFEFLNTMNKYFDDLDVYIYIDYQRTWYANGFEGITSTIEESAEYLKEKMKGYERTIFMGTSSGGYASILFGSILAGTKVVAFMPQTDLSYANITVGKQISQAHSDLLPFINDTTEYHLYVNTADSHPVHAPYHIERVDALGKSNVYKKAIVRDLKYMRDNGVLIPLLEDIFYN